MDVVRTIEAFCLQIPRETPYLGPLEAGLQPSAKGLYVRPGNQTYYSVHDHSVLIKMTTQDGAVGWGECFGALAPRIVATIVEELAEPMIVGRSPHQAVAIFDDLYDSLRVRGYSGGFWLDAIAGLDQALWDLRGKLLGLPVSLLLGAQRARKLPAYASGLPAASMEERVAMARAWVQKGFQAIKFAGAVASRGELAEMRALRAAVGSDVRILADLHWRYTAPEAITLISAMEAYGLAVAEAPVKPEDVDGLRRVAASVKTRVAAGEEWRTVHEYRPRLAAQCMSIVQPEMLRMGVTGFYRVCLLAEAFHARIMPHATVGVGIGQAASLHVAAACRGFEMHEYQPSIFDRNLAFVDTAMKCERGYFHLPAGSGLGAEPKAELFDFLQPAG